MFLLRLIWVLVRALFTKRADLVAENLALRQQLIVLSLPKTPSALILQDFRSGDGSFVPE